VSEKDSDQKALGTTGRIKRLHDHYRVAFSLEFDPVQFRSDDFYAFQVLEKAIADGSPEIVELARIMRDIRLAEMDQSDRIEVVALPGTDLADNATKIVPLRPRAAPPAGASAPRPGRKGPERRGSTQRTAGHVRLTVREVTLLSQMRNQYRKTFGSYFDAFEFTGNDLYARATLLQCIGSDNMGLIELARYFLTDDGKPRFHRRLGTADVELDFPGS
jgi:hypothetical protein